jgi:hypothetical protein
VVLPELYSPRSIPGVTGTLIREGRRPGWPDSWWPCSRGAGDSASSAPWSENFCAMVSCVQAQRRPKEGEMLEEENDMKYVQEEDEVLGEGEEKFDGGKRKEECRNKVFQK